MNLRSLIGAVLLVAGASSFGPPSQEVPRLPVPTGPHPIGTNVLHLVDVDRKELATQDTEDARELTLQVWYPAEVDDERRHSRYVRRLEALGENPPDRIVEIMSRMETHAAFDSPGDRSRGPYPLVLVSHALGGSRHQYTVLLQELASHGYIAVAIDHAYLGRAVLRDGTVTTPTLDHVSCPSQLTLDYALDAIAVLDEMERLSTDARTGLDGMIDPRRVALIGHGASAEGVLSAAWLDRRIDAAVLVEPSEPRLAVERLVGAALLLVHSGEEPVPLPKPGEPHGGSVHELHLGGGTDASPSDVPWLEAVLAGDRESARGRRERAALIHRTILGFLGERLQNRRWDEIERVREVVD